MSVTSGVRLNLYSVFRCDSCSPDRSCAQPVVRVGLFCWLVGEVQLATLSASSSPHGRVRRGAAPRERVEHGGRQLGRVEVRDVHELHRRRGASRLTAVSQMASASAALSPSAVAWPAAGMCALAMASVWKDRKQCSPSPERTWAKVCGASECAGAADNSENEPEKSACSCTSARRLPLPLLLALPASSWESAGASTESTPRESRGAPARSLSVSAASDETRSWRRA